MFEDDVNIPINYQIVVLVSGGFDPIHSGHLDYLSKSYRLGDVLIVGLNSDDWLVRKKGYYFQSFNERRKILQSIRWVDDVIYFNDADDTAINAIEIVKDKYPKSKIIFANGGDRDITNIPEFGIEGVEYVFGVGGTDKITSSSKIIKEYETRRYEQFG